MRPWKESFLRISLESCAAVFCIYLSVNVSVLGSSCGHFIRTVTEAPVLRNAVTLQVGFMPWAYLRAGAVQAEALSRRIVKDNILSTYFI
jgi:hypothetical protein